MTTTTTYAAVLAERNALHRATADRGIRNTPRVLRQIAALDAQLDALRPAPTPLPRCPECNLYGGQYIDGRHLCTVYDGPVCATAGCDEPTVFVTVAAPGTGSGRECRAGHFHGRSRIMTLGEVR